MCLCDHVVRPGQARLPQPLPKPEACALRKVRPCVDGIAPLHDALMCHQGRDLLVHQRSLVLRSCLLQAMM